VNKSKRIRWVVYVACVEKRRRHTGFWWENLREREFLKILGIDGRIIKRILKKSFGSAWAGFVCLKIRTVDGYL
jgi:hypothetical protein